MSVRTGDICLVGGVTALSCYQLAIFARKVGKARTKFSIDPPKTDGPEEFQRIFRAHQNCLEVFPMFMGTMWTSALFVHQVPASVVGLGYLITRHHYFKEYSKDSKRRMKPFILGIRCLQTLLLMSMLGVGNSISVKYFGYDAFLQIVAKVFSLFGNKD